MKKNLFLAAMILLLAAWSISAQQKTTDFSGDWQLDLVESKLDERARVESMTMKVAQTEKDVKIETATKRAENGNGMNRGGGMMGGGNQTLTYTLDGKETQIQQETQMGAVPVTLKAKIEDGKLKLSSVRTFNGQMGEVKITVNETWSLSNEGRTLTVKREMQTPRGSNSSELIFTKVEYLRSMALTDRTNTQTTETPLNISGGVVNGKARNLVAPKYPEAARAARASGQVSVAVTIDEEGNVISAQAVSGNPLLRTASEEAVRASKFAPTLLEGKPVKVTGVIVYNFVP